MYTYDKVNNVFPHIIFLVFKLWEHKDICMYVYIQAKFCEKLEDKPVKDIIFC